jgi:formylglycine-generating enzyme required for sulfatase activity
MVRVVARLLLVLAWLFAAQAALADTRVALVIGNAKYTHAGTLANPVNDASDMAAALKGAGFIVIPGYNLDKSALEKKIREFASALSGADTGVFFYAGHGLQVAGTNYIVPVDAELSTADALEFEMIKLDAVQRIMENAAKTNILFLDACRNNPLARNLARALGTRGDTIGRGLAPAESGIGTLISFSTQPGNVAQDGAGRNSPYTGPLVKRIAAPGEDILSVLTAVRNEVLAATGNKQVPWENHALTARFYFNPTQVEPKVQTPLSADAQAWSVVQNSASTAVLAEFIRRFPASVYAGFAKARLEELKRGQVAMNVPELPLTQPEAAACDDGLLVSVAVGRKPCIKPGSGDSFKDCPECPEMVIVPSGSFVMGSAKAEVDALVKEFGTQLEPDLKSEVPQHNVVIEKPFAVGRFPIKRDEFEAFVKDSGYDTETGCRIWTGNEWKQDKTKSWISPGYPQTGVHPAVCLYWHDVKSYVEWLSRKTGKEYRLLSEAEREYVTRAGHKTPFWWGASITTAKANYNLNYPYPGGNAGDNRQRALPVKFFEPNPWGLFQVHGNVHDWVEDCWNENYAAVSSDGSAVITGDCSRHVIRGGSWVTYSMGLRAAARDKYFGAGTRLNNIGFRVARAVAP